MGHITLSEVSRLSGLDYDDLRTRACRGEFEPWRAARYKWQGSLIAALLEGTEKRGCATSTPTRCASPVSLQGQRMGNGATVEGWRTAATAERAVYLSDLHCPHHDPRAVACALSFIRWFDPAKVFLLGDICDFYQLSRFDRRPDRNLELQGDLDATREVLTRIRDAVPSAQVVYLEGNHEARLTKYLWKHPEVAGLNALRLPHLLGLDDLDISYVSADTVYRYGGLCIEHGEIVRARSGYSARGQLDRRGVSGVSGHTHRLSVHYHTDLAGVHWWAENGCLCGLTPEYLKAPDWQQGFTVTHTDPSGRIAVEQVLVSDGSAVFAGRVFGG